MTPVQKHRFDQGKLLQGRQVLGICFRVTFKWLALQMVGRGFKFEKLDSTIKKQVDYGKSSLDAISDPTFDATRDKDVDDFLQRDLANARTFLNRWGAKFHDDKGKERGGITFADAAPVSLTRYQQERPLKWDRLAVMVGFYMPESAVKVQKDLPSFPLGPNPNRAVMSGHVIGLHAASRLVFDANFGEFKLDAKTDNDAVKEIESYIEAEAHRHSTKAFRHCVIRLVKG